MGRPFKKELEELSITYDWAENLDIESLRTRIICDSTNFYVIGSGGSFSAAYYLSYLLSKQGKTSRALTPLELYDLKESISDKHLIFLSASGKNSDILLSFELAVSQEPSRISTVSFVRDSKLSKKCGKYSITKSYSYTPPVKKDGYLSTNSLLAFFIIFSRLFDYALNRQSFLAYKDKFFINSVEEFTKKILSRRNNIYILFSSWGRSIAVDLESKYSEAAISNVLVSDLRNFGHGRHNWFNLEKESSAVIYIQTQDNTALNKKTISLLPKDIPVFNLSSNFSEANASIELLVKSFYLVLKSAEIKGIDPGRPVIPSYGRKLYNLQYKNLLQYKDHSKKQFYEELCINRKLRRITNYQNSDSSLHKIYELAFKQNIKKIRQCNFKALVLDYDGTVCGAEDRFSGPNKETADQLNLLLEKGIKLAFATGRGKSIRSDLQKIINNKFWNQILIGYYNCSDIGKLSDNSIPNKNKTEIKKPILKIIDLIDNDRYLYNLDYKSKYSQLSIQFKLNEMFLRQRLIEKISKDLDSVLIVESSHSLDIIIRPEVSKLNILPEVRKLLDSENDKILCIGDKGNFPGNDFELLSYKYSISVDEVSPNPEAAWNYSPIGIKNVDSFNYYMKKIKFEDKGFKIAL